MGVHRELHQGLHSRKRHIKAKRAEQGILDMEKKIKGLYKVNGNSIFCSYTKYKYTVY